MLVVSIANSDDSADWAQFLKNQRDRPPIAAPEWNYVLEHSYGRKLECLIAREPAGRVVGVIMFHDAIDWRRKRRIFSAPWGLVAIHQAAAEALTSRLRSIAIARNCVSASVTSGAQFYDLPYRHSKRQTFILELEPDESTMWNKLRGRTRNAIRKGEKSALTVVREWRALPDFFRVYANRMVEKQVPFHSVEYFRAVEKILGDRSEIFAAFNGSRVEGAMLVIYGDEIASYPWGAVNPGSTSVRAGQFLLWELAKACMARGIRRLDLGESSSGSGTWNFKTEFGASPVDIHYYNLLAAPEVPSTEGNVSQQRQVSLSFLGRAESWLLANLPFSITSRLLQHLRRGGRLF